MGTISRLGNCAEFETLAKRMAFALGVCLCVSANLLSSCKGPAPAPPDFGSSTDYYPYLESISAPSVAQVGEEVVINLQFSAADSAIFSNPRLVWEGTPYSSAYYRALNQGQLADGEFVGPVISDGGQTQSGQTFGPATDTFQWIVAFDTPGMHWLYVQTLMNREQGGVSALVRNHAYAEDMYDFEIRSFSIEVTQ